MHGKGAGSGEGSSGVLQPDREAGASGAADRRVIRCGEGDLEAGVLGMMELEGATVLVRPVGFGRPVMEMDGEGWIAETRHGDAAFLWSG